MSWTTSELIILIMARCQGYSQVEVRDFLIDICQSYRSIKAIENKTNDLKLNHPAIWDADVKQFKESEVYELILRWIDLGHIDTEETMELTKLGSNYSPWHTWYTRKFVEDLVESIESGPQAPTV